MILAGRNQVGLTEEEIERCLLAWKLLCGEKERELVIDEAHQHSSRTRFNETSGKVHLGADVKPGIGTQANSRMSELACLAHELAHAERFEIGFQRPIELPDSLIDESETSLHASFMPVLSSKDREDLVEDARDRLIQWIAEMSAEKQKELDV
jgi:hypothetical protein